MNAARRLLLPLLTAGSLVPAVTPAWAAFTNRTAHTAAASFTTTTIGAPGVTSGVRCLLSNTVPVAWTPSSSTIVVSQLVEISTSAGMSPVAASKALNDRTTASTTFGGLGVLSALTVYYVRVTARYAGWSTPSAVWTTTSSALC